MYEYMYARICLHTYVCRYPLSKCTRLRSYSGLTFIHFTAPCRITCVLLSKASLRSADELARPARPELHRDQFCDFVLSAADCPADEDSDVADRHGGSLRCGPRIYHQRQQEHSISTKSGRLTTNSGWPQARRIHANLHFQFCARSHYF